MAVPQARTSAPGVLFLFLASVAAMCNACGSGSAPAQARATTDAGTEQSMRPAEGGTTPGDAGGTDSASADAGNASGVSATPPGRVNGMSACTPAPCAPETLADHLLKPTTFRASDTYLYWVARASETGSTTSVVQRMPIQGGTVETPTDPATMSGLTLDASFLYFGDDDTQAIDRVPLTGGAAQQLAPIAMVPNVDGSVTHPFGIVAYADRLYFSVSGGLVLRVGKDGTGLSGIALGGSLVIDLVVDNDNLYFRDSDTVFRIPHTGGATTTMFKAQAGSFINALRLDDAYVYWTVAPSSVAGQGQVQRMPKAGGAVETLATGLDQPTAIAIDSTDVYFADSRSDVSPGSGVIERIQSPNGAPTVLVENIANPYSLIVTATDVYWTNAGFHERHHCRRKHPTHRQVTRPLTWVGTADWHSTLLLRGVSAPFLRQFAASCC